jgi:hypothetical protein
MAPSPAAGHRTATLVSPLKSRLLDRARADCSPASAPGLHSWWLRGCGSSAIALASFLLLTMAAAAVPLAPLIPATPVAAAAAGAPSGMNGPKRPGVIPPRLPEPASTGTRAERGPHCEPITGNPSVLL